MGMDRSCVLENNRLDNSRAPHSSSLGIVRPESGATLAVDDWFLASGGEPLHRMRGEQVKFILPG